jgi:hypothetical protein
MTFKQYRVPMYVLVAAQSPQEAIAVVERGIDQAVGDFLSPFIDLEFIPDMGVTQIPAADSEGGDTD